MFKLIRANGKGPRMSLEQELLHLWAPVLRGNIAVFGEELQQIAPHVKLMEDDKQIRVTAELPGVDEQDIRVNVTQEGLSISGEKKYLSEEKKQGTYHFASSFGTFRRLVRLPENIDRSKAAATFKKGILKVIIPKRPNTTA